MDKDYRDHGDDGYNKNTNNFDYDDEMGRRAVGKLFSDLDNEDTAPSPDKPVVRAIRINSEKIKKEKINTVFYDEDRANVSSNSDAIVTGFKEEEELPEEEVVEEEPVPPNDEELADAIRTRRPNILKDEDHDEQEQRKRYKQQFLEGYTDHNRKGLDFMSNTNGGEPKRRPAPPSSDEIDSPMSSDGDEPERTRRRRPKEDAKSKDDAAGLGASQRPRRQRDSDDEAALAPKRPGRRESSSAQIAQGGTPSYDAPIFKILAAVFVVMIVIMVILIVNINGANSTIRGLEANLAEVEADIDELASLRAQNLALETRVSTATDESNQRQAQIEDLERQLLAATTPSALPTNNNAPPSGETAPEGMRRHTVQSGETLYRISTTFFGHPRGVDAIMRANNLTDTNIRAGNELIIPESYQ